MHGSAVTVARPAPWLLGILFVVSVAVPTVAVVWMPREVIRDRLPLGREIEVNAAVVTAAIVLDVVVLIAFVILKLQQDPVIIWVSLFGMIAIFGGEWLFLRRRA